MMMENISPASCPFYNSIADLIKTDFSDWSTSILYGNLAKQFFFINLRGKDGQLSCK